MKCRALAPLENENPVQASLSTKGPHFLARHFVTNGRPARQLPLAASLKVGRDVANAGQMNQTLHQCFDGVLRTHH